MGYFFEREDTGEIVEVSWEVMMDQDVTGRIEIDGASARRRRDLEQTPKPERRVTEKAPLQRDLVSDTLGFGETAFNDFEADRVAHGFHGVEFTRDPDVPQFYQVRFRSTRDRDRYIKHRGFVNRTGLGGVRFTEEELERAEELVSRRLEEGNDTG